VLPEGHYSERDLIERFSMRIRPGAGLAALQDPRLFCDFFGLAPDEILQESLEFLFESAREGWSITSLFEAKASNYFADQKYEEALSAYERIFALSTPNARLYVERARVFAALERNDEAISDLGCALALDNEMALAHLNRGIIYESLGELPSSIADLDRAIEINPNVALAYKRRGGVHLKLNNCASALTDFNTAIDLAPNDGVSFLGRAITHTFVGNFLEAMADYDRSERLGVQDAERLRIEAESDFVSMSIRQLSATSSRELIGELVRKFPFMLSTAYRNLLISRYAELPMESRSNLKERIQWLEDTIQSA
jgi:tetratricopeptide (TPR) repeat protein